MNRKIKTLLIALLFIFALSCALAACSVNEIPKDKDYDFDNTDGKVYATPDEGFVIDGKANEEAYKNVTWTNVSNQNGNDTVDVAMTSYFGQKGMYFVYDVTESTPIYVNPNRSSYINSGIEMYLAPKGVTGMASDHIYEIDLEADGTLTFKKSAGKGGEWVDVGTTSDIMARLASQPKGGESNTDDCYGYTLELFIPWDYISWLGMNPETMKDEYVSVNPAHITSYNYEGTTYQTDRYWYSFATQLGGDGWDNVGQYFRFDKNGVTGTVPVTLGEGEHCALSAPSDVVAGLPVKVTVTPEEGYAVSSLKCNDEECIKYVSYNRDGSATYTVRPDSAVAFSAKAEAVTAGNKNLTGKIVVKKAGGDTLDGLSATYSGAEGEKKLALTADGSFSLNLPQGYYVISAEKKGYGKISRGIYLNRDVNTQIDLEYGMFDVTDGSCWDISHANEGYLVKKGGRGAILSKDSYGAFYVEASFRYDEDLAALSKTDEYYQQRMGFRIKFSDGKYWHPDVMCEGGVFKVTYGKILKDESIFNWNTVYVMSQKQIDKYTSEEGIKFGILRVGTTAYIYLDGELVATTDLGREGIKANETAQIGFEGYVYNSQNWRIDYEIDADEPNVVRLGEVNATGATVQLDNPPYAVGDDVTLALNKADDNYVLLSLIVNGEEMSGSVVSEEGVDLLVIAKNTARILNVEAVYGIPQRITANITVDSQWRANGIEFTFTNKSNADEVYSGTVANNRITVENILQGVYAVKANVFGAYLELGDYAVVSEADKLLYVEKVFINGKELDASAIDLANGNLIYHSSVNEDYSIRINKTGDAYLAAKLSLNAADKAKLLNGGEVSFGMYMTVKDANGKATTHYTNIWIKVADDADLIKIRTDFDWDENVCTSFKAQANSNKYSKALFGDGLYFILRYKAETGVMETYLGSNDFSVAYLRDWNDKDNADHLFPANGTVTAAGFRDDLGWGDTSVTVNVQSFRYGQTLLEALGVAGKTVTLDKAVTNGMVELDGSPKAGQDVTLIVTPESEKILSSLVVNGVEMASQVVNGRITLKNCTAAVLNVTASFEQIKRVDVTVTVSGSKLGVEGNALEGKTVTLSNGEFTYTGVVTDVKVTFDDVVVTGNYRLSSTGLMSQSTFDVPEDGVLEAFTLVYDMTNQAQEWGWGDGGTLSGKSGDTYTHVNGSTVWYVTNNAFDDVIVKVNVKSDINGRQGAMVKFGNDYVMIQLEKTGNGYKVTWNGDSGYASWNTGVNNILKEVWTAQIPSLDAMQLAAMEKGNFYVGLVRQGNVIYAIVNDVCYNKITVDEKYADMKCQVGFYGTDVKAGAERKFYVSDDISATVTDVTSDNAHGAISIDGAENAKLGSSVITVTVTPEEGYKLASLTINGQDVFEDFVGGVTDNVYTFNVGSSVTSIKATFDLIKRVTATVTVTGNKLGVTGNALEGVSVTLAMGSFSYTGIVTDGKVTFNEVVMGSNYTLSAAGFISKTGIVVPENGAVEAVSLEYDSFAAHRGWGTWNFTAQNTTGVIGSTNEAEAAFTKNTYGDVAFTLYLAKREANKDGNQGIAFRFGKEVITLRMEGTQKIQFCERDWILDDLSNASGNTYQDLIFFTAGDKYLTKYANGTLKLTCVRRGATFFVYLDDEYIGQRTFDSKYANMQANVGFYYLGLTKDVDKTFKVDMPDFWTYQVTDATTDTNGAVAISSASPRIGDKVTVTFTPNSGYVVKSLTVGGKDVTGSLRFDKTTLVGTYEFTVTGDNVVIAAFEEAHYVAIDAAIGGSKYGETDPINLDGVKIKLSNAMAEYEITVENGKIAQQNILAGEYALTADGYVSQTVIITADGTYSEAIVLAYNIFTAESGSADLSELSSGKVTATGNGGISLTTEESYLNVTAEAHFDVPDYNGRRYGITLVFSDGKNFRIDFAVQDQGNNILQETNFNGDKDLLTWKQVNSYSEDDIKTKFMVNGLDFKLERIGKTIKLYIDNELIKTYTLDDVYESMDAQIKFIFDSNGTDGTKGFTFDITVPVTEQA